MEGKFDGMMARVILIEKHLVVRPLFDRYDSKSWLGDALTKSGNNLGVCVCLFKRCGQFICHKDYFGIFTGTYNSLNSR